MRNISVRITIGNSEQHLLEDRIYLSPVNDSLRMFVGDYEGEVLITINSKSEHIQEVDIDDSRLRTLGYSLAESKKTIARRLNEWIDDALR